MDPDLWFPQTGEHANQAKAVCKVCPVTADCRTYASRTHATFGIWAGVRARQVKGFHQEPEEKKVCRRPGCFEDSRSLGLCKRHYEQQRLRRKSVA